ncbi:hypothetical protein C482_03729 [Natrialba chahannaoensis JCM 10990]|uniref:Uncharacterized protein n=1 Tax=Natrialba chahannaoensis JCM 10990 TaxID=1227492 RepID=M0AZY9_9EURY|nr:hypothetical protein C482_03729 [Natrialba chahannaoensis JCM 10990]
MREIVDGDLEDRNGTLHAHTGRVPSDLGKVLSFRQEARQRHHEVSGKFEDSRRFTEAVGTVETQRTTDAIHSGNQSQLAFAHGVIERRYDATAVPELSKLYGIVRNPGQILNFCGGTDNGKTNVLFLAIDTKMDVEPETLAIGNVPAEYIDHQWTEYYCAESMDDLVDRVDEEPDRPKIIFVDDASIDHSEHSASAAEVKERQGRLARLAAKQKAVLAYVGHREDGYDLSKHIRAMPGVKHLQALRLDNPDGTTDRYVTTVYNDQNEDSGGLTDRDFTLDPLPKSRTEYDPDVVAHNLFAN